MSIEVYREHGSDYISRFLTYWIIFGMWFGHGP